MGFGEKWCKWMDESLRSSSMSILVNGSPIEEFMLERGDRQGDLLSPFLFILVTKRLNEIVNEAVGCEGDGYVDELWCWGISFYILREKCIWTLVEDGEFKVKALTRLLEEKNFQVESGVQETTWNNLVPRKVNVFIWRVIKGRLLVRVKLDRRGIDLDSVLFLSCNNSVESCAHSLPLVTLL
nr:ribonuclease H [Tanacetum cinerariifolium]